MGDGASGLCAGSRVVPLLARHFNGRGEIGCLHDTVAGSAVRVGDINAGNSGNGSLLGLRCGQCK